jgi:hypothetical protein
LLFFACYLPTILIGTISTGFSESLESWLSLATLCFLPIQTSVNLYLAMQKPDVKIAVLSFAKMLLPFFNTTEEMEEDAREESKAAGDGARRTVKFAEEEQVAPSGYIARNLTRQASTRRDLRWTGEDRYGSSEVTEIDKSDNSHRFHQDLESAEYSPTDKPEDGANARRHQWKRQNQAYAVCKTLIMEEIFCIFCI